MSLCLQLPLSLSFPPVFFSHKRSQTHAVIHTCKCYPGLRLCVKWLIKKILFALETFLKWRLHKILLLTAVIMELTSFAQYQLCVSLWQNVILESTILPKRQVWLIKNDISILDESGPRSTTSASSAVGQEGASGNCAINGWEKGRGEVKGMWGERAVALQEKLTVLQLKWNRRPSSSVLVGQPSPIHPIRWRLLF